MHRATCAEDTLYWWWWWHPSLPVIVTGRRLGIRTVITGAIHIFHDVSGARDFYSASWPFRFLTALGLRWADAKLFISHDQFRQITSHLPAAATEDAGRRRMDDPARREQIG